MRVLFWVVLYLHASVAIAQSMIFDDGSVPYVVTPMIVVDRMLRLAEVGEGDRLIDLGSGDGRIVIAAARRGAQALGVEIDPALVVEAREHAAQAGVSARARFEVKDLFQVDLSQASVITMYLLPEVNLQLAPKLLALRPGTRIVSHDWDMGQWRADETLELQAPEKPVGGRNGLTRVHLWVVPANLAGRWVARIEGVDVAFEFRVRQVHQDLEVTAAAAGRELLVRGSGLRGADLTLVVSGLLNARATNLLLQGTLTGERLAGEASLYDGDVRQRLRWHAVRLPGQ